MPRNAGGTLMFQGTGSDVGKSVITAAFLRALKMDGIHAAPFKAQNMALNSAVTPDQHEIGRAQAFQAEAAGIPPQAEMNPILLKPTGDQCSQLIVMGKPQGLFKAREYYAEKRKLLPVVMEAFEKLKSQHSLIVLEGAGSPAEINLQDDFSNMGIAQEAGAPVILVGDIDRGGVFAWMKGTFDLLKPHEQELLKGFLINKFRGDVSLLMPGIKMFSEMVNRPVLGTLPYLHEMYADAEDSMNITSLATVSDRKGKKEELLYITVIQLPRISNFTDFAPLGFERDVSLSFAAQPRELDNADVVIIPGSKNSVEDLHFLCRSGFKEAIEAHVQRGGVLIGICGGFQMLGLSIKDPEGVETAKGTDIKALGYLAMETSLTEEKQLTETELITVASDLFPAGVKVSGYEIHMGRSRKVSQAGVLSSSPLFEEDEGESDNISALISSCGRVFGTYLHNCFADDDFRQAFLSKVRSEKGLEEQKGYCFRERKEKELDRLGAWFKENTQYEALKEILFH